MHLHNQVPVLILHVLEANVTEDTSIVDKDVYPAKCLESGLNDGLSVLDTVVVGNGLAASLLDLLDNEIGILRGSSSVGKL